MAVLALVAVLTIVLSAPAHVLEGVSSAFEPSHVTEVRADVAPKGKQGITLHEATGHSCASHCAAHNLSSPPEPFAAEAPSHLAAVWPAPVDYAGGASPIYGLKHPPRA